MAPKARRGGSTQKEKDAAKDVQETEDPLQAVVLADSFETRFRPFTLEKPRCLLPVANTPLIEYTLQFLANAGVDEVYLYCGLNCEQVEDYLAKSRWSQPSSPFDLRILRSTSNSIGDAMRDLDKKGILKNDFIIVYGDVISNLTLDAALAEHRARRSASKDAIMTMVLREAGADHRTKVQEPSPVFLIDPIKKRCLHYEQMSSKQDHRHVQIDPDLLWRHEELQIRHDLIDCGIDICTPDVLALWSDNFDYEVPRKGFLHSVLKDFELNGKTIHTHIVKDHYAARVRNLKAYDSVTKDVVSRYAYPMCPDSNLQDDQSYRTRKGNVSLEEGVKLAKSCAVGPNSILGRGTSVGDESKVINSVIGRNCSIGRKCVIDRAYLWDNVTVGDSSEIRHSIVADRADVGSSCKVLDGALISFGIKLADGTMVDQGRRLTRAKRKHGENDEASSHSGDVEGYDFSPSESEDGEAGAGLLSYEVTDLSISTASISTLGTDDSDDEPMFEHSFATGSSVSLASDESEQPAAASESFHQDATSSIQDSLQKNHDVSTIQLELQGLRLSANASDHQVRRAVVAAFMKHIAETRSTAISSTDTVKDVLSKNKMILQRTMFDKNDKVKRDQVDFLLLTQMALAKVPSGDDILAAVCLELYNLDVLEEEGLEQWWGDQRSLVTEELRRVRQTTQKFMDALTALESESDEEEDEDDDDEED